MKRSTKYALGAAVIAGVASIAAAAPASAQPYGYYYNTPRGVVCDPYSRFYDPFYCVRQPYGYGYYGSPYYYGGPSISLGFGFGGGFRDGWRGGRNDWRGGDHRGDWDRGGDHRGGFNGGSGGHHR